MVLGSETEFSSILLGIYILYATYYANVFLLIAGGSVIEILIFALGIGHKLQQEAKDRVKQQVKINLELEEKVSACTRQIQEQKEEILVKMKSW